MKALRKYDIIYFRCASCGFVQTDDSHLLDEASTSAITDIDIGHVGRSISGLVEGMIVKNFDKNAKLLDYGGGVRPVLNLIRDRGFDFHWHDLLRET